MEHTEQQNQRINRCLLQIEEKLGWGESKLWHSEVFSELSDLIMEQTGIKLSATTLKRVWGKVAYSSKPSISTLNALSQFLGYQNWRDFKDQNPVTDPIKTIDPQRDKSRIRVLALASGLALLFVSLFSLILPSLPNRDIPLELIEFSSKPVSKGIPNSVVFEFDVSAIKNRSLKIQQSWDETKTIQIRSDQTHATGIYYYPGYFRSKLLIDGAIVKEHDLYIKSEGWLGTLDYEPIPKYFEEPQILHSKGMSFPNEAVFEIQSATDPIQSAFHFVDDFGHVEADDFTLNTTLQNEFNERWAVCQLTSIVILGSKGAMIIPFAIPGCASEINLMLNDRYLSGKENDLSALGVDFHIPQYIQFQVTNQSVEISIGDQKVMTESYDEPVGKLAGIRIRFIGAGKILNLVVQDDTGHPVLSL